jgi:hypothetical protein
MSRTAWWLIGTASCALLLAIALPVAWLTWRESHLRAFCAEVRVGMPLQELFRVERAHRIDNSYLVEAQFPDFVDQAHSHRLGFQSFNLDPLSDCAIGHDGAVVTSVVLLE